MKIALITVHATNNYGGVLQAFATKVMLSRHGDVNVINYKNHFLSRQLDILRMEVSMHGVKKLLHDLARIPYRYKAVRKFQKFIRDNLSLSPEVTAKQLHSNFLSNYDVYICGSDQIWNPAIISAEQKIDPVYFLSFVNNVSARKISYASSIGNYDYSDAEKAIVKRLIQSFDYISVREKDGIGKIKELPHNGKISHVLDPTLLLNKQEWIAAVGAEVFTKCEAYILVYSVPRTRLLRTAVDHFKRNLKLKVVSIDQMLLPSAKVDKHVRTAGPKEFIQLMVNASFIITDSFHGVCFALNFGKHFAAISAGGRSNRILSILEVAGCKKNFIEDSKDLVDFLKVEHNIDNIQEKLTQARAQSMSYLNDALGSAEYDT